MRAFVLYVVTLGLTTHSFATLDFEAANSLQCLDEKRLLLPRSPCGRDSGSTKLLPRNSSVDEEREERDEGDEQLTSSGRHLAPSQAESLAEPSEQRHVEIEALPPPRLGGGRRGGRGSTRGGSGGNGQGSGYRGSTGVSSTRGSSLGTSFGGNSNSAPWRGGSGTSSSTPWRGSSSFGGNSNTGSWRGGSSGSSQSRGGNSGISQGQTGAGGQRGGNSQTGASQGNSQGNSQFRGGSQQGGRGSQQGGNTGVSQGNRGGQNNGNKGNQNPKNGGQGGKGNEPGRGGNRDERGNNKPTRTLPHLLPYQPTSTCQCQPAMCQLRGREGCECRAGAATWCRSQQGPGCAVPFVESCDHLPYRPILAKPPLATTYYIPQTFMECVGPGCSTYQTTITTVAVPPWWTPYGPNKPYQYPGFPAAVTISPNPPPPPPPIGVPITVTVPVIVTATSTLSVAWGTNYVSEFPTPTVTTVVTVIQPVTTTEPYAQVTPPVILTGYVPAQQTWGTETRTIWNTATQTVWNTATAWRTDTLTVVSKGPTVYVTKTVAGQATTITVMQNPANTPRVSSQDLGPVTVTVTVDEPIVEGPIIIQGAPSSQQTGPPRTTLTIPAETISVEGQQPIIIPMSIVTVTDWPPRGANAYGPTAPSKPKPAPVLPDGAPGKPVGWTAIIPEAPFTPGPSVKVASTAFFEPAVSGLPGVPIFEVPAKCGPNSPRCDDDLYCDPQPLCGVGAACPGVCLPVYGGKFSQPPTVRNQIWDKVMAEGVYKVDVVVTEVRYLERTTLLRKTREAEMTRG